MKVWYIDGFFFSKKVCWFGLNIRLCMLCCFVFPPYFFFGFRNGNKIILNFFILLHS